MSGYNKFVKKPVTSEGFDFPRGSVVENSLFRILTRDSVKQPFIKFGRNPKDVVNFSLYSDNNDIIKTKLVKPNDRFIRKSFNFIDYDGIRRTGNISIFNSKYELTDKNEVVVSPTHELRELGEDSGSFLVGISLKTELVGSHESTAKLVIQDISPSRTELKIAPAAFKTTLRPSEVALNNEYYNFIDKRIPISHIYHEIKTFTKNVRVTNQVVKLRGDNFSTDDYNERLLNLVDFFNFNSFEDFGQECQEMYDEIRDLYGNLFLYKYNDIFSKENFYEEYVKCVSYVIEKSSRFLNYSTDEYETHKKLYEDTLLSLFDDEPISEIFNARFNSYLSNIMMLDGGDAIPVVSVNRGVDNINDNRLHRPLIFKLQQPLPTKIQKGALFYIDSSIYSDDAIQRVLLYKSVKPKTFKLRNPDLSGLAGQGTRSYSAEQLHNNKSEIEKNSLLDLNTDDPGVLKKIKDVESEWRTEVFETPLRVTEEISRYFNNQSEDHYLSVDYSDFTNFIRYSSARKRLDVFIFKLAKISEIDRQLEQIRRSFRNSNPEMFSRLSYDSQITKLNGEKLDILNALDGYERFLFFEDLTELTEEAKEVRNEIDKIELEIKNLGPYHEGVPSLQRKKRELDTKLLYTYVSWPRETIDCDYVDDWNSSVTDYGPDDYVVYEGGIYIHRESVLSSDNLPPNNVESNWTLLCNCGECVGKKIPLNSKTYTFLSTRVYYRPMPIPESMEEFAKTPGYMWYSQKAAAADIYDKHNDNSLFNNTPEFLTRDVENEEYFDFLSFIGHQFDLIHLYVEGIGNIRQPLNDPNKGIPNELVSHMLDYFGGNFEGYDDGEINSLVYQVKTQEQLEYIKNFKEKKHLVWRRILNNLPYILKTIGTEKSIRALFRCYGVPDYLFRIREFGGIEYNTETSDKVLYTFDSFDYYINFSKHNQYIKLDWKTDLYESRSLEFKFSFDENLVDITKEVEIINGYSFEESKSFWKFGFEPKYNKQDAGWGKFYFKIGDRVVYAKDAIQKNMVYPFSQKSFNVLIQVSESTRWTESGIHVYIKRYSDEDLVYNSNIQLAIRPEILQNFTRPSSVVIGNVTSSNFFGRIDRIRIYNKSIEESRFENHIKFNQSYDVENPFDLEESLLFKANFDFPYKLNELETGDNFESETTGYIQNTSLRADTSKRAVAYNFTKSEYPYDFGGENSRQFARLPSYGAQVFNNNKIRIETQELESQLSVLKRSTKKSGDRLTIDTNKLGVYFSPTDLINHEVLRFFGDFELGDYIGDPRELYNHTYEGFRSVKNLFFKHGFGKVDFSYYLSILESYLDPSLFKNIEKVIPARTQLISGLVVEQSLLERNKIKRRPIDNELIVYDDVNIKAGLSDTNITSHANARSYYDISDTDVTGHKVNVKYTSNRTNTYPSELNLNYYKNIPNEAMYGISTYRGFGPSSKIELQNLTYKRYVRSDTSSITYTAIRITGKILKDSEFNCEVFGNITKDSSAYIHRDATIGGVSVVENIIPISSFDSSGYAKLVFNFAGHRLIGKLYGDVSILIQNGTIKNVVVLGKIGSRIFEECDTRGNQSIFTGPINQLVSSGRLTGTATRKIVYENKTRFNEVVVEKEDSDVNIVNIPKYITQRVPVVINTDTSFKLKNTESRYISTSGEYVCNLNMFIASQLTPPPICTFSVKWIRRDSSTNTEVISFRRSSYDYMDNLKSVEHLDESRFTKNFELPAIEVYDTTATLINKNTSFDSGECENRKGRYAGFQRINTESDTPRVESLDVGDIILKKSYEIPFEFTQNLRVNRKDHDADVKLGVSFESGILTTFLHDTQGNLVSRPDVNKTSILGVPSTLLESISGNYKFFNFKNNSIFVVVECMDCLSTEIGDVVLLSGVEWEHPRSQRVPLCDINDIYCEVISLDHDQDSDSETIELKLPHWIDLRKYSNMAYLSGGVLQKVVTSFKYTHETQSGVYYDLELVADYNRDSCKTAFPAAKDEDVKIGDRVNVVFREGAFLWIARGIRVAENAKVVDISTVTDRTSKYYNSRLLKLQLDGSNDDYIEIVPSAEYVYGLEIVKEESQTPTNYQVKFKKSYKVQLGPSSSPLATFEFKTNINSENTASVEFPFDYYNLIDIGNSSGKILNGVLDTHRKFFRNTLRRDYSNISNLHCRRSISYLNNTVSPEGVPNMTPPIVRTRRAAIRDGIGDTFWYLEDTTYSTPLSCGVQPSVPEQTPTTTSDDSEISDELNLDSLELNYTFENVESDNTLIVDNSGKSHDGTLVGGVIRNGGSHRSYRNVLSLDNDIGISEDNVEQHIDVSLPDNPIRTNDGCTMSFWIRPIGISEDNAGILINNSAQKNDRHGLVLNPNGNRLSLGYAWKSSSTSHLIDLDTKLTDDTWSHVTVIFYRIGIVKVFLNKVFVQSYDLGVEHEEVVFDKLEVGRFSGMIDDIRIYNEELDYGDVSLSKSATEIVGKLYDNSRPNVSDEDSLVNGCTSLPLLDVYDFVYYQDRKFKEANVLYLENESKKDDPTLSPDTRRRMKFKIRGGVNDGETKFATAEFMGNMCGSIKEET